ncbi:MAG: TetR/AcrR family transcriptional regulator [Actinomycetaceae bacterium]|nr:TetR/AcrR family transcriptional regulator [Actinomycetaceae bacterium]
MNPRVSKPAAERRGEILDAAQRLFTTAGVAATSIDHILSEVGIAKGTLYYHFRSKDEILRALIERTTEQVVARASEIANGDDKALPKFLAVLASMRIEETEFTEELHAEGNAEFHILSIVSMIRGIAPILTTIVEQGIREGIFATDRPREMVEILLAASGTLLDRGIFVGDETEIPRRTEGILTAAEVLLGCAQGTFTGRLAANDES